MIQKKNLYSNHNLNNSKAKWWLMLMEFSTYNLHNIKVNQFQCHKHRECQLECHLNIKVCNPEWLLFNMEWVQVFLLWLRINNLQCLQWQPQQHNNNQFITWLQCNLISLKDLQLDQMANHFQHLLSISNVLNAITKAIQT